MDMQAYINDIYNNIVCDFTDMISCEAWRKEHSDDKYSDTPLFSYMMTTYNDDRLLNAAINSLLRQSFMDWELIVLDNSDQNEGVWKMLCNAMYADKRIHAFKSERNVGWAKGASICLEHVKGVYTSFLAADDCVNAETLGYMSRILEREAPDILWVGVCATEYGEREASVTGARIPPEYRIWEPRGNRSHAIAEVIRDVYYNSFFHYMKVSFLREHNIDFFEPYYGDCGGMIEAVIHAEKMIAIDKLIYFLTENTSQTKGWWLWDICKSRTILQWTGIRELFLSETSGRREDMEYIAERIMGNVTADMHALCLGRCRDKYMNPIEVSGQDILSQLEEILFCDEVSEMLSLAGAVFPELLEAFGLIAEAEYILYDEDIENSRLAPLLKLAIYGGELDLRRWLDGMVDWLVSEENPRCVGFEYFCLLLRQGDDRLIGEYAQAYRDIAARKRSAV